MCRRETPNERAGPVYSEEQAIAVAERYAKAVGLQIPSRQKPLVTWHATTENDFLRNADTNSYQAKIRAAIVGRKYWLVAFRPEGPQLGGEYAFFVDEQTGKVLAHYAGR